MDELLWDREVEKVRAEWDAMTPAVAAAVHSVLESIAGEQAVDERVALGARTLLDELAGAVRLRAA